MGTNFYWNTENPDVLKYLEKYGGDWRAPLRRDYFDAISQDQAKELRKLGVDEEYVRAQEVERYPELRDLSHIGKRSAAGLFCYSCNAWFHDPAGCDKRPEEGRLTCKYCGRGPKPEMNRSTKMELGLAPPEEKRPTEGVRGTCTFAWANWPDEVYGVLTKAPSDLLLVVDEYGRELTANQFIKMLRANVDITKMSIGHIFS